MGVVADPALSQLRWEGGWWRKFSLEIRFLEIIRKLPDCVREIYQDGKSYFWTNSLIEEDGRVTAVCSLPKVFLHTPIVFHEARSILQQTRKSMKLNVFSLCDYHHVKFFMDVYRQKHLFLRKNTCCANQADWRRVNCDHDGHKNDLSENQEYLKEQQQKERKDNKLPQEYMWAPLFPNYLLDIQHIQNRNHQQNYFICYFALVCKYVFRHSNSDVGWWTGCFYFHKENCKPVSEKLTTMSFIIALKVVKRKAKVFRAI